MSPVIRLLAPALAFVLLASCEQPAEPTEPDLTQVLQAMPADFDELDPPVQEQFRELQSAAVDAYSDSSADAAGAAHAVGRLGMWYQVYYAWDPDTAFRLYAEAAQLSPRDARWPYYSGFTALKLGRLGEARAAFEQVLLLNPDDVAALLHLAEIDLQQDQTAPARERLLRALELQPGSARILAGLGNAAFQDEDYPQAIEYFQQALEVFPDAPQLSYKMALAYQRSGETEKAERLFASTRHSQTVLDMAFDNPYQRALLDLNVGSLSRVSAARQAMAAGNREAAIRLAREGVEIAANRKTPLLNLASIYLRGGMPAEAIATVNTIETEFGLLAPAVILRAVARERIGDLDAALDDYRIVIEDDPGNLQALIGAGEVARRKGDLEQATAFYDQAAQTNPGEVAPRLMRARALWYLGRLGELRRTLGEDVAVHPDSAWLLGLQGRLTVIGDDPGQIRHGLTISVAAYRLQTSVFNAQSIAMGLAGLGRFDDAALWQQLAVSSLFSTASPDLFQLAQQRLDRIQSGEATWPAALDDFDTLNAPLDNPPPPPVL